MNAAPVFVQRIGKISKKKRSPTAYQMVLRRTGTHQLRFEFYVASVFPIAFLVPLQRLPLHGLRHDSLLSCSLHACMDAVGSRQSPVKLSKMAKFIIFFTTRDTL